MLSLLLTACSGPLHAGSDALPADNGLVTIKVVDRGEPWLDSLIAGFDDAHPQYRIEKVHISFSPPGGVDYGEYVKRQLSEGAVDVVDPSILGLEPDYGLFLPLEPFIQKSKFDVAPYGPALDQLKHEGKLYGLPMANAPDVILYNADLLQTAGVPFPQAGWTWEDFRRTAAKVTRGEGDGKVWGLFDHYGSSVVNIYTSLTTGRSYAGGSEPLATVKEALQLFTAMSFTDQSMPKPPKLGDANPNPTGESRDLFNQGKAGMVMDNLSAFRSRARESHVKVEVAPFPAVLGGKSTSIAWPRVVGIAAGSRHPEAAWAFLMYAAGAPGAEVLARMGTLPMYRSDAVKKAWFDQQPAPPASTEFLFTTTFVVAKVERSFPGKTPTREQNGQLGHLSLRADDIIKSAMSGALSVDDAMHQYGQVQDEKRKVMQ